MTKLKLLTDEPRTWSFMNHPTFVKTLTQFMEYFGAERQAAVSREISKLMNKPCEARWPNWWNTLPQPSRVARL
jgi:16S rRNA C1402 (ribose-2'-O) methylase RsmI